MKLRALIAVVIFLSMLVLCACSAPLATLNQDDIYKLVKGSYTSVELESAERPELAGDWYGYWRLTSAFGQWEDLEEYCCDCLARLSGNGEELLLTVWDEDTSESYYLALFYLKAGDKLRCTEAEFLDVKCEAAEVSLDESGLLSIGGNYYKSGEGGFHYQLYLRQWGDDWEDDHYRPRQYENWYLPMLDEGVGMPELIAMD